MNLGESIKDQPLLETIPEGTAYLVEAGDGSGTMQVKHETVVSEIEKALPIGDMEELKELEELEVPGDQDEQEEPAPKGRFTLVKGLLKLLAVATSEFKGTNGIKKGIAGLVPAPGPEDKGKVLGADGRWITASSSGGDVNAEKVKFADEKNAEEKLGGIDGMTADLNCENEKIAASAAGLKKVNDKFGGITEFITDPDTGRITGYKTEAGADTEFPFNMRIEGGSVEILDEKSAGGGGALASYTFSSDETILCIAANSVSHLNKGENSLSISGADSILYDHNFTAQHTVGSYNCYLAIKMWFCSVKSGDEITVTSSSDGSQTAIRRAIIMKL